MTKWARWKSEKSVQDNYYIQKDVVVYLLDNSNGERKKFRLTNNLTIVKSSELESPVGWRKFDMGNYHILIEEENVLYEPLWETY